MAGAPLALSARAMLKNFELQSWACALQHRSGSCANPTRCAAVLSRQGTLITMPDADDELCQFIPHCSCGRFKAKCRMPYNSFVQEVQHELMLRVWQHGEALTATHPNLTWAGVDAWAVER